MLRSLLACLPACHVHTYYIHTYYVVRAYLDGTFHRVGTASGHSCLVPWRTGTPHPPTHPLAPSDAQLSVTRCRSLSPTVTRCRPPPTHRHPLTSTHRALRPLCPLEPRGTTHYEPATRYTLLGRPSSRYLQTTVPWPARLSQLGAGASAVPTPSRTLRGPPQPSPAQRAPLPPNWAAPGGFPLPPVSSFGLSPSAGELHLFLCLLTTASSAAIVRGHLRHRVYCCGFTFTVPLTIPTSCSSPNSQPPCGDRQLAAPARRLCSLWPSPPASQPSQPKPAVHQQ